MSREKTYILSEHADELARIKPSKSVRLLGAFDQYVLGPATKDPHTLAPAHRAKVSKAPGWIVPIVVVGGRITGVWELTDNEVRVSGPRLLRNAGVGAAHVRDHGLQHATDSAILEFA